MFGLSVGFAFLTYIFSRMLFLQTWVVAIAMILLFFYDIIMVFITPYMTEVSWCGPVTFGGIHLYLHTHTHTRQSHDSVMVKAATGGSSDAEPLPIVFRVPKLLTSALEETCSDLLGGYWPYSLLGYGDAGIPGLLVARCLHFDLAHKPHLFRGRLRPYFTVAGLGELCVCVESVTPVISLSPSLSLFLPPSLSLSLPPSLPLQPTVWG